MTDSKAECRDLGERLVLSNDYLSLEIVLEGGINPTSLRCKKTGKVYADSRYRYKHLVWERQTKINQYVAHSVERRSEKGSDIGVEVQVAGRLGDLELKHEFFVPNSKPYLEETITVKNMGKKALNTPNIFFGFAKALTDNEGLLLKDSENCKVVAVPYRRECWYGLNGEYIEYSLQDLLSGKVGTDPGSSKKKKLHRTSLGQKDGPGPMANLHYWLPNTT